VRQCFYIVACYQEAEHDFTTPLTPACGPSPKGLRGDACARDLHVRRRHSLPKSVNPLDESQGTVARLLLPVHDRSVRRAAREIRDLLCRRDRATGEGTLVEGHANFNYQTVFQAFCELRGLLLLYLKKHPDQYNCRPNKTCWR